VTKGGAVYIDSPAESPVFSTASYGDAPAVDYVWARVHDCRVAGPPISAGVRGAALTAWSFGDVAADLALGRAERARVSE
jgi:hypothetical protein